jgi:transposase
LHLQVRTAPKTHCVAVDLVHGGIAGIRYERNETRQLALDLGFIPVVPALSTRVEPWEYDREMYKRRNELERLFRRLKGFRRIFSRFDKLDLMFIAFINFALIVEALR